MQEARVKRSVEVSAVVTRANGKVEDLGVIASTQKGNVVETLFKKPVNCNSGDTVEITK